MNLSEMKRRLYNLINRFKPATIRSGPSIPPPSAVEDESTAIGVQDTGGDFTTVVFIEDYPTEALWATGRSEKEAMQVAFNSAIDWLKDNVSEEEYKRENGWKVNGLFYFGRVGPFGSDQNWDRTKNAGEGGYAITLYLNRENENWWLR